MLPILLPCSPCLIPLIPDPALSPPTPQAYLSRDSLSPLAAAQLHPEELAVYSEWVQERKEGKQGGPMCVNVCVYVCVRLCACACV